MVVFRVIYRPWGYFIVLFNIKFVLIKKIVIYPHKRTSLQKHFYRSEIWISNKIEFIPKNKIHRIENNTNKDIVIYEIQIGNCFEEDIKRIEDDYGRLPD